LTSKNGANLTPSVTAARRVAVNVATTVPSRATAFGVAVAEGGPTPKQVRLDRSRLAASGFTGKVGQTLVIPQTDGPVVIAVGIGSEKNLDAARLRDAAAAFARAASRHSKLATNLTNVNGVDAGEAAAAVVEGVFLARYRYHAFKRDASESALEELTLISESRRVQAVKEGIDHGRIMAAAAQLSRDLANAPSTQMTARHMAKVATTLGPACRLKVEVFDDKALQRMGCGGLLGVNAGSAEPARLIRLRYQPKGATGHLALVGKGITYDSGGISLKPTHAMMAMKMDMAGAGAVLSAMTALSAMGCRTAVTGYLMCTDNMPSGTALRLGDVLTIRNGMTVEIRNTDAEGRLVLADGLVLATEDNPDAIVDIATLTGACMRALGTRVAGVIGNHQGFVEQVEAAAMNTDEPVWQLPLDKRYRSQIDSEIADLNNIGGENPGAITAALFLAEFVDGIPWAHIDIAGPMHSDADESWRPKGATGFGARLLVDLAMNFRRPGKTTAVQRAA
jgi:leucyl aminopeptidase